MTQFSYLSVGITVRTSFRFWKDGMKLCLLFSTGPNVSSQMSKMKTVFKIIFKIMF